MSAVSMSTITLRWVEGTMMVASDSNGHSVVIGRSPDPAHDWVGIKPSELLLMAVASCATHDVVGIMAKQREPLQNIKVLCSGDQQASPPYTFTRIHLHYIAYGPVNPLRLERAIRLSEDKYCSVISSLRPGVVVTSDFEVVP